MSGDTQSVDAAGVDFQHEEDVEAAKQHGVDMQEVAGQQAVGLRLQERPPR